MEHLLWIWKNAFFFGFFWLLLFFYLPRFLASTGIHIQVPNKRTNPNNKGKAVKYAFMTTFGRNFPRWKNGRYKQKYTYHQLISNWILAKNGHTQLIKYLCNSSKLSVTHAFLKNTQPFFLIVRSWCYKTWVPLLCTWSVAVKVELHGSTLLRAIVCFVFCVPYVYA